MLAFMNRVTDKHDWETKVSVLFYLSDNILIYENSGFVGVRPIGRREMESRSA